MGQIYKRRLGAKKRQETEESNIADAIKFAANCGVPFTTHDLRNFVQGYLNRKGIKHNHLPMKVLLVWPIIFL